MEFGGYTVPIEQSDGVLRAGRRDNVQRGLSTIKYR